MALRRYGDRGEFWDAWDIASDYTGHALPMRWEADEEQLELGASVHAVALARPLRAEPAATLGAPTSG